MKSARLEILLFTDTRFSSRQLLRQFDTGRQDNSGKCKSLEAACRNPTRSAAGAVLGSAEPQKIYAMKSNAGEPFFRT
jgi:hypothetical protein